MPTNIIKKIKPYINVNNGVLVVALLITINWAWGTIDAIQNNFVLQQQVDTLAQQNDYYTLQNETLHYQQDYYKTNEYLELSARTWLNKANPGEKELLLPKNTVSAPPEPSPVSTSKPITQQSNFEQWMYFLFGNKQS
jgi:cell division protein FtsB